MEREDCALWSALGTESGRPRKMLPRRCKTFLTEVFAGAATLSALAGGMGLSFSLPISVIYDDRNNVLKKSNRDALEKLIDTEDPFLLTLAPICGPYLAASSSASSGIQFCNGWQGSYSRLARGRKVLVENPWPSSSMSPSTTLSPTSPLSCRALTSVMYVRPCGQAVWLAASESHRSDAVFTKDERSIATVLRRKSLASAVGGQQSQQESSTVAGDTLLQHLHGCGGRDEESGDEGDEGRICNGGSTRRSGGDGST